MIQRVLVDNKLVAEIGKRHLLGARPEALRCRREWRRVGVDGGPTKPVTGRTAEGVERVFRMLGRMTFLLIDRATIFDRKVGIEPIEGVLDSQRREP